jgi:hypothetical protein
MAFEAELDRSAGYRRAKFEARHACIGFADRIIPLQEAVSGLIVPKANLDALGIIEKLGLILH